MKFSPQKGNGNSLAVVLTDTHVSRRHLNSQDAEANSFCLVPLGGVLMREPNGLPHKRGRGPPAELWCRGSRGGSHCQIGFKWGHTGPQETARQVTHRSTCECPVSARALPQGDAGGGGCRAPSPPWRGGRCGGRGWRRTSQIRTETGLRLI